MDKKRNKSDWDPHRSSNNGKEQCQAKGFIKLILSVKKEHTGAEAKEDQRRDEKETKKTANCLSECITFWTPFKFSIAMWADEMTSCSVIELYLLGTQRAFKRNHAVLSDGRKIRLQPTHFILAILLRFSSVSREGLDARDIPSQDEVVNIVGALVGLDRFKVSHVAHDGVLIENSIGTVNVP